MYLGEKCTWSVPKQVQMLSSADCKAIRILANYLRERESSIPYSNFPPRFPTSKCNSFDYKKTKNFRRKFIHSISDASPLNINHTGSISAIENSCVTFCHLTIEFGVGSVAINIG